MPGFEEIKFEKDFLPHSSDFLRDELQCFQKKEKPIGWNISGAELKFLKVEELKDSDLSLFDQIENQEINASNVIVLEKAVKGNFIGVSQKNEVSRYHFQAFLQNLIMCKWNVFLKEQSKKTLH